MNSFETDIKRAVCSVNFLAGLVVEIFILSQYGIEADLFAVSVPVAVTLPYAAAWINDYQSGFLKAYLPRCGVPAYVAGKFFACTLSGGGVLGIACFAYLHTEAGKNAEVNIMLVFLSGMLWAAVAATLAAISDSRYIAYGGSFVLFYVLVILHERYFEGLYCLYPVEWYNPKHTWIFGDAGIVLLVTAVLVILFFVYYETLRRKIEHV
ncbi:MAG: hypothetical protein NC124_09925 [Clostridium sp.]|nr:hypothetical protein [Clostridium sp.]